MKVSTMIRYCFFAFVLAFVSLAAPTQAKAQKPEGLSTPRPLWNTDTSSQTEEEDDEDEEEDGEEKKKKRRLKDSASTQPIRPHVEEEEPELKPEKEINVDMNFSNDARNIANSCPQRWENESCLKATSQAALVLVSNYGGRLDQAGKKNYMETLKEDCAASTAATQEEGIPAYAMKSAYTVCMNSIVEIADGSGVKPDPSYMQLLLATVWCMEKSPQCEMMELALRKWAK